jgi:hypothetical protein
MPSQRYSPQQIESFIQEAERDGFVVLRNHFSREKLRTWAEDFPPHRELGYEEKKGWLTSRTFLASTPRLERTVGAQPR